MLLGLGIAFDCFGVVLGLRGLGGAGCCLGGLGICLFRVLVISCCLLLVGLCVAGF